MLVPLGAADVTGMRLAGIPMLLAAATCSAADFHLDVGVHFGVPQREVIVVREQRVPDHELPVVFFIARHARVAPAAVVDLRLAGHHWCDIASRFRLAPEVFYVSAGPPYGKAHGHWKKRRLADAEIVEAVNVRFLSEYHHVPANEIYVLRSRGLGYSAVHANLVGRRHHRHGDDDDDDDDRGRGRKYSKKHR